MPEVFNVLMVGVGGQGTVLASDILAEAAMNAGLDVKKSEIHGMSQRGGPVFAHVRFGEHVDSPVIGQGEADVLYSLERMELLEITAVTQPPVAGSREQRRLFEFALRVSLKQPGAPASAPAGAGSAPRPA